MEKFLRRILSNRPINQISKYSALKQECAHLFYIGYATHYDDVIMTMLASQITSLTVVYSIVYSGVNLRKHQSSASLAFVWEIHRGPVNFPHKWPVTRKMFPFDDVIMRCIVWIMRLAYYTATFLKGKITHPCPLFLLLPLEFSYVELGSFWEQ